MPPSTPSPAPSPQEDLPVAVPATPTTDMHTVRVAPTLAHCVVAAPSPASAVATAAPTPTSPHFSTPTADKKRKVDDSAEAPVGDRVAMWHTVELRKISGNAAPMAKNLKSYLKRHPACEIYNGQDKLIDKKERARHRAAAAKLAKAHSEMPEGVEELMGPSATPDDLHDAVVEDTSLLINLIEGPYPFLRPRSPSPDTPRAPFYPVAKRTNPGPAHDDGDLGDRLLDIPTAIDVDDMPPSRPGSPSSFLAQDLFADAVSDQSLDHGDKVNQSCESSVHGTTWGGVGTGCTGSKPDIDFFHQSLDDLNAFFVGLTD